MTIIFHAVKGSNLTPNEVDGNFEDLDDRVTFIEDNPPEAISIATIDVTGNVLTITMTDATEYVFTLDTTINIVFRGEWAPSTAYFVGDIITYNGAVYIVSFDHTSDLTFDPGANDGLGHDYYGPLLEQPGSIVPVGGTTGQSLKKASDDDYDIEWVTDELALLDDVAVTTPVADDLLTWDGSDWVNTPREGMYALENLSDIGFDSSTTDGDLLTLSGSTWTSTPRQDLLDFTDLTGVAVPAQVRQSTVTVLGTSGTVSLNPDLGDVFSCTPTNNITLNASAATAGAMITIIVSTSGTSSYNITPNTNFKSTGVLATGTVSGKVFVLHFVGNGTNLNEVARTVAM